jgi:hypothetical protein
MALMATITLKNRIQWEDLKKLLAQTLFKGIYDKDGNHALPYADAEFSFARVFPQKSIGEFPKVVAEDGEAALYTAQPTIYQNQIEILGQVDVFLQEQGIDFTDLREGVEYNWEGRGLFHILPPVVEDHVYDLQNGFINLEEMLKRFRGFFVKDAAGNLHHMGDRYLQAFYVDEVSKMDHLDIFNSNAPVINYGLRYSGPTHFNIICDGSHRIDYATEKLQKPMTVILVRPKPGKQLIPYYALPVPFLPFIRISSKLAEHMYPRLERDKIHLLNDHIKKVLHYNWGNNQLSISKLRSNTEIY